MSSRKSRITENDPLVEWNSDTKVWEFHRSSHLPPSYLLARLVRFTGNTGAVLRQGSCHETWDILGTRFSVLQQSIRFPCSPSLTCCT